MTQLPNGKAIALDLGDVWIGFAISDPLWIVARPLETVQLPALIQALEKLFEKEKITTAVVGCPITFKGTKSEQTKKIELQYQELQKQFPKISWHLWDERLSSKRAAAVQSTKKLKKKKAQKQQNHSIAAAFILDSFLQHYQMTRTVSE